MRRFALISTACAGLAAASAAAAPPPRALAGVAPGLWEVSRTAAGTGARRMCVSNVLELGSYALSGRQCDRTILRRDSGGVLLDISCAGGDFARSTIEVTTPRSLRIQTQGIRAGEPFDMRLYARRSGSCLPLSRRR